MPWRVMQVTTALGPDPAGAPCPPCVLCPTPVFPTDVQAAGVVLVAWPAALTGPLDRSQAPGWPRMVLACSVKVVPPGPVCDGRAFPSAVIGMTVWSGGARWGRTHSGIATWSAA